MSTEKITQTLQRIKNDRTLEDYFFKKLAGASKPIDWLFPLKDAGYFNPENNPKPEEVNNKPGYFTIPHWNVLDALENMAIKNEESPDDNVSKTLLEIVDNIIAYREEGRRIDNYRTDWKVLEILSRLPIEYIGIQHIEFIKDALDPSIGGSLVDHEVGRLFLPKLVKERAVDLILTLLDILFQYKKSEKTTIREYVPIIDSYYLKEALDKNKKGIANLCPVEAANVAIAKMREILEEDKSQFNFIWIPTIEDHPQTTFPDRYECQMVHFVRDMLEAADPGQVKPMVKDMLAEEYDIFKRLAFHLINHHYNSFHELLWNLPYNPLSGLTIHEIYELFTEHCSAFNDNQISTVLNWIETQKFYFSDEAQEDDGKKKLLEAYYKKEWLLALMGSGSDEVKRLYQLYDDVNDAPIDHPGFHYWSSGVGWVKDVSPIEEDEFKKKSNKEIVEYVNSYIEQSDASWKEFTRINLASSVRKFVSNDPERYCKDMDPFLELPLKYKYELIRGFEEAWRNSKEFNWEELLVFIKGVLGEPKFFEAVAEENKYSRWIIDTVADLIHEGTKDDKHAFPLELMGHAEEIVLILLQNVNFGMDHVNDVLTSFLNSSKGKVFMAAINYSLRYARQLSDAKESRWVQPIKDDFTRRLDKAYEPGLEFSVAMGSYLPNLHYLDKEWIERNINNIFDFGSEKHWEAAITGHIIMTSTVYEEIYKLLRYNGHYEKALGYNFADQHIGDKLVQNLAIGYVAGWDDLDDKNGLMFKLLEASKPEYLANLVTFIWSFSGKDRPELASRVKPLWASIIRRVVDRSGEEPYQKVLSDLGKWLGLVDSLDEDVLGYVKASLPFIEKNWNAYQLLKGLAKHVLSEPTKVGELFLDLLNAGTYPSYEKSDVINIVQNLYAVGMKDTANKICNKYYFQGFEFLREIFETNNSVS